MNYGYKYHPHNHSKRRIRRLFPSFLALPTLLLASLIVLVVGAVVILSKPSSLPQTNKILALFSHRSQAIDQAQLGAVLNPLLPKDWTIGIYIYDPTTDSSYGYNEDKVFQAASLTKLPVLLTLYDEIQKGTYTFSKQIPIRKDEVQDYGTSVLQYNGPDTQYDLNDLATYMINRSDNTSFAVLVDLLGEDKINQNLLNWGFQKTNISDNTTTPKEMGRMFTYISNVRLIHGQLGLSMQKLMVGTNEERRIPAGVPTGVNVIHKTGSGVGGFQDAGIVMLKDRPYIISILTYSAPDEDGADATEARISQAVYKYMSTLP